MVKLESSDFEKQPPNYGKVDDDDDDEKQQKKNSDEDVLKFMDSLHSYLLLLDSLSTTLRQGWFDFASARHSMGASRVNSVLLDLKEHSAATHLEVTKDPRFTLCKWVSDDVVDQKNLKEGDSAVRQESNSLHQHKDTSQLTETEDSSPSGSSISVDQVQRERSKSLAVFGKLVSPKLRAAQFSFETALEKLVEIANVQASMLYAFEQVREHIDSAEN